MLTANKLSKSYNLTSILKDISFTVNGGERVGLIGPNGSGKSTLLHILLGHERPDGGHVAFSPTSLRVGYLAQGFDPDPTATIGSILHEVAGDPERLEAELGELAMAMAEEPENEAILVAYDAVLQRLSHSDMGQAQSILANLGLAEIPEETPVAYLSGGQKTRLALALVLLDNPQLLLLDEPTNHLDIEMLEWLESWLANFSGGVLIVSHDRTFLDRTATRILDLDPHTQTIREYVGNYSDYLAQYVAEREKQTAVWRDQVYEIRKMKQDINRTAEQARHVERTTKPNQPHVRRLAKKVAKKAKSREKKLERYVESDERVEKPSRSWQMKLDFVDTGHIGRDVLRLEDLAVGYRGFQPLLSNLNLDIQAGQRVIITGQNGAGKTTLLRTIAGEIGAINGRFHLGGSVKLGYMSQDQEILDPTSTALETIQRSAPLNETDARSFLHFFLFADDDPLRPIANLSYGERSRLMLASLMAQGCNFLLLDEPINHLDIPSRTQFEQALLQYEGTILAVVHDRYFIERFATDLWLVKDGEITTKIMR
ncbi:MAG: ABC-F family ATP-binding cassette domain-containing protein [Chloroflexota bacterium]